MKDPLRHLIREFPHHIRGNLEIDHPVFISEGVYLDNSADVEIGRNVTLSREVQIWTHQHRFHPDLDPVEATEKYGVELIPLFIMRAVYIGARAIICPQVRIIGAGTVIGAGSVLTKETGQREVWAGNPARCIGKRGDNWREPKMEEGIL